MQDIIKKNLSKYNKSKEDYYRYRINNLIFHRKSHYTSIFVEYLIWDDNLEFINKLFPKKYSIMNLQSYLKYKYHKKAILRGVFYRKIMRKNENMKKILYIYLSQKRIQKIDNRKNIVKKKYSYILPKDLTEITFEENNNNNNNNNININTKEKEKEKSESTIDNVNANNDITVSLDLRINKNYDMNILMENLGFVKGINENNDNDLIRMLKYFKPININYIYNIKKNTIKNNYFYLGYKNNNKSKDKNKQEKDSTNLTKNILEKKNNNKNKIYSSYNTFNDIGNIKNKKYYKCNSKINIKKDNKKKINNIIIINNNYADINNKSLNTKIIPYKNKRNNKNDFLNNYGNKYIKQTPYLTANTSQSKTTTVFSNDYNTLKEEEKLSKENSYKFINKIKKNILKENVDINIIKYNSIISKEKLENKSPIKIYKIERRKIKKNENSSKNLKFSPNLKKSFLNFKISNKINISSNSIFKKEKSLENLISSKLNNKNSYYKQIYKKEKKENKNIIIIKNKKSNNVNIIN